MLGLTQASATTKPNVKRNTNGVFSGKKPAKIVPFKKQGAPPDTHNTPSPPAQDSPFVAWLRTQHPGFGPFQCHVHDYLLGGPPFKGFRGRGPKNLIKDVGGRWYRNTAKEEGCKDYNVVPGWWVAPDEKVLVQLLALPRDLGSGMRTWTCADLGDSQLGWVEKWLWEYRVHIGESPNVAPHTREEKRPRVALEEKSPTWILACADGHYIRPAKPDPACPLCGTAISDQFLDCRCGLDVRWKQCIKCTGKYREGFAFEEEGMCESGGCA